MTGRPSDYNEAIVAMICERIADGESLRSICRSDDMPAKSTVFKWLSQQPSFADQYTRAKEESAETYADEITYIADTEEDVNRAKVRIDARKWVASKLKPKKYGDKTILSGDDENPLKFERVERVIVDPADSNR